MKMRNGMYLFATAIVASTVGLSSCSNDEDVVGGGEASGVAQKVTLGVYVNGVGKKASQADVNLGGSVADISNVLIVPVAGGQYQVPISFGEITGGVKQSKVVETSLQTTVNEFLVYGNVPTDVTNAGNGAFGGFDYSVEAANPDKTNFETHGITEDVCGPLALVYGADAKKFSTSMDATTENFWNGANWTGEQSSIASTTHGIKITGVKYQVGVMASKIFENTKYVQGDVPFTGGEALTAENWNEQICKNMKLTGIFVEGQNSTINDKLEWSKPTWLLDTPVDGVEIATRNDEAWEGNVSKIKTEEVEGTGVKVYGADFYTVVAPDGADGIVVSFQFQNNTGRTLTLDDGNTVASGAYAYYSVKLNKKESKDIFAAATTTVLNARITDWGKGSVVPPTTTDVVIGVEFDVEWAAGLSYDFEI